MDSPSGTTNRTSAWVPAERGVAAGALAAAGRSRTAAPRRTPARRPTGPSPGGPVKIQAWVIAPVGAGLAAGTIAAAAAAAAAQRRDRLLLPDQVGEDRRPSSAQPGCQLAVGCAGRHRAAGPARRRRRCSAAGAGGSGDRRRRGGVGAAGSAGRAAGGSGQQRPATRSATAAAISSGRPRRVEHQVALAGRRRPGRGTRTGPARGTPATRSPAGRRRRRGGRPGSGPTRGSMSSSTTRSGLRPPVAQDGQPGDLLDRQRAAGALVGQRRVDVPVADHDRAAGQRRAHDGGHVVGPVGGVEQRLGARGDGGAGAVPAGRAPGCGSARRRRWRPARG